MITDKMREDYDNYLTQHISNVKNAFDWLVENLPELFKLYDADYLGSIISQHDESKYEDEEYYPYCEYFYGDKTDEVKEEFDKAWLHHQHNNPHHWQHWLLREDDGDLKPIEMEEIYVFEMISDWWAFSWYKEDLYEIFNWYKDNKSKMQLHENTKKLVEDILDKLKSKLDEMN